MHIVKREIITVPAGTFDTFRIEGEGWNDLWGVHGEMTRWLVPGLNTIVKEEQIRRNRKGGYNQADRVELVSLRQHAFDTGCAPSADKLKRSLSVKGNCAG
jgi:hypothetical protein